MAVKTDVVLLADAGDVTVARRTAFYTYGKFEVILPEGREQQETDNRIEDGYIARAHDGNVGRFDFGFIRADATVNIDAGTSDLETQIDSAELRAEGDVFFEGDITPSGFNGFIPGVDYDSGDIVTVRRWGTSLALPVTSIELEVSESAGTRASRVHVSGQLIHDAASRRRSNDDLRQQIAAEKRERLRQVGAVDRKASNAQSTADGADSKAGEAKEGVVEVDASTSEALEGESYNMLLQLQAQQDELARALSNQVNEVFVTQEGSTWEGMEILPPQDPQWDWSIVLPDSHGAMVLMRTYEQGDPVGGGGSFYNPGTPQLYPSVPENVRINFTGGTFVHLVWAKPSASQHSIAQTITDSFTPARSEWVTVQNLIASPNFPASNGYLTAKVTWAAANRGSTYGVRFLIGGDPRGEYTSTTIGPVTFLGDGEKWQRTSVSNVDIPAGTHVVVQVYSAAGANARRVRSVELSGTWIETRTS